MGIEINIFNPNDFDNIPRNLIEKSVKSVLSQYKIQIDFLNVVFLNDDEIQELNKNFLEHDYPTDVISFRLEDDDLEGEIYIGYETAKVNAAEFNASFEEEILRLVIHGTLHLLGFDDASEAEKVKMKELENKYLKIVYG